MSSARIPRIFADLKDRDKRNRVKVTYSNAFQHFSLNQEVLVVDGSLEVRAVVVEIDGDTIWIR